MRERERERERKRGREGDNQRETKQDIRIFRERLMEEREYKREIHTRDGE